MMKKADFTSESKYIKRFFYHSKVLTSTVVCANWCVRHYID